MPFPQGIIPWNKGTKGLQVAWNKGKPLSEELKKRVSETLKRKGIRPPSRKGVKLTEKQKAKLPKTFLGRKHSEEAKRKIGLAHRGKILSERVRRKISLSKIGCKKSSNAYSFPTGQSNPNWKGIQDSFHHKVRSTAEWRDWRNKVFERDGYKCLDCGDGGFLEPHHILPIRKEEYRSRTFDTNNGITLCRPCHQKTFGKEEELAMSYFALIPTQM